VQQFHGAIAVAETRERVGEPEARVRVLPAVLADAGRYPWM
jgi:hypothetical protein